MFYHHIIGLLSSILKKMLDTIHINYMLILMPKSRHMLRMKKINHASEVKSRKKQCQDIHKDSISQFIKGIQDKNSVAEFF